MSKQVFVAIMLLRQSIEQAFVFFRVFSEGKRDPPVPVRAQQGHPTIFCNLTNLFGTPRLVFWLTAAICVPENGY